MQVYFESLSFAEFEYLNIWRICLQVNWSPVKSIL